MDGVGRDIYLGICMLLTAGYSIDIIDLVGMSFLFDHPLLNILGTRLDEIFYTLTSVSWQSCDSFSIVVVWTSYNQRMRCPGLGFTPLFPSFSLDRLISHIGLNDVCMHVVGYLVVFVFSQKKKESRGEHLLLTHSLSYPYSN